MLEAKGKFRQTIYREFYQTEYKYAYESSGSRTAQSIDPPIEDIDDTPVPIDPFERSGATKPFISPSLPDEDSPLPFGRALDAPLR